MNRKERRASRATGAKPAFGSSATTLADLFNTAVARHQSGAFAEAERQYRHILTLFPSHAETESRLGAVLMAQGKIDDALSHLERAIALQPDLFEACANLGQAYLAAGQVKSAVEAAGRTLELKETPQGNAFFVQCARLVRFTSDNGRFHKLALRALSEGWARPRELTGVCISLIKLNPAVNDAIARTSAAWPARLPASEMFGASGLAALAQDQLLHVLLECDPTTDIGLERLLTNVRHAMLTASAGDEALLGFYCAVARQCFINGYVFSTTESEAEDAQRLRASLDAALAAGETCPAHWPAVVGAYFPLHTLSNAQALPAQSWPQSVDALIAQQVKEPAEERRIAAAIPALTAVDDEVSRAVREQYEESPYPRWVKTGTQWQTAANEPRSQQAFDTLIAGCGTGLSTIEFARQAPRARIVAIDLSLASLSYAKRMAQSFGLTSIEFAQADLTKLGSLGRTFDVIDASGVLHHLADPWQGWRVLLSLLRPGGAMQVGLYSEAARQNIVAARALIAERGYRPIAEDIRRCREAIIGSDDPLLRSVMQSEDFFATNECRDLLFHVEEHRIALPEIKSFLAESGVQFAGFLVDAPTQSRFTARFPQRDALTDLASWAAFESEAPQTFANMYQFWVHKAAARS
jgi:2-polyprenyl-3-methyl-5-hydroxy-6-metoxy-1,4-benzoquinol methylase/tetratricopeptide (TPR) repeat protein